MWTQSMWTMIELLLRCILLRCLLNLSWISTGLSSIYIYLFIYIHLIVLIIIIIFVYDMGVQTSNLNNFWRVVWIYDGAVWSKLCTFAWTNGLALKCVSTSRHHGSLRLCSTDWRHPNHPLDEDIQTLHDEHDWLMQNRNWIEFTMNLLDTIG